MILETSQRQLSELVIHQLNALFTPPVLGEESQIISKAIVILAIM